jgi:potassium-dependent mechanosensitive channel
VSPFRRQSLLPLALLPLAASACLAFALGARADVAPDANAQQTAPAAAAPVPIPAPEIASRAEAAKTLLQHIAEQQSAEDPVRAEVAAKLPGASEKLRSRRTQAEALIAGSPTTSALNDVDAEWRARAKRLADWRVALTRSAQNLDANRSQLADERAVWERTREGAADAGLPPATQTRVNETIAALSAGEARLRAQVSAVLELQNEVAEEEIVVREVVDRVAKKRAELGKQLWMRDTPALWTAAAWASPGDGATLRDSLAEALQRRVELVQEFFALSVERVELEGALFVAVLLAILVTRRRVIAAATAHTDAALAVPTRIVERPISAGLVVALISVTWLAARTPGLLSEVEAIVLLVPVLRLLPTELYGVLRPGLIALAALFLSGSARGLFAAVPQVERFLLLLESLGAATLMLWLQRPALGVRLRAIGRFGASVLPVARVAFALSVVAIVCNAIGMVQLARLLLRGVLGSFYAAIALYALARFTGGVVTALVRSDTVRKLRSIRDHGELVRRRAFTVLQWLSVFAWLVTALRLFGLDAAVRGALATAFGARLEVGTVSLSLGNVVAFCASLWLASQLSRFVRFVLDEDVLPRIALPRGVPAAISTGLHYTILAAGVFIAIGAAGVDLSKFTILAGALGVGIGFGLQNVVNNFVSGLILLFERPVQTGDTIQIGDVQGEVKRIGIRSSTLRTGEGADVIVPNASLISERVVNWTFSDRTRRIDLPIGVAYGSDPNKVIALLVETARAREDVLSLPEPVALLVGFGPSTLDFQLRVWCRVELGSQVRSSLGVAVLEAFTSAGIEIPLPQHDITLKVDRPPGAV